MAAGFRSRQARIPPSMRAFSCRPLRAPQRHLVNGALTLTLTQVFHDAMPNREAEKFNQTFVRVLGFLRKYKCSSSPNGRLV